MFMTLSKALKECRSAWERIPPVYLQTRQDLVACNPHGSLQPQIDCQQRNLLFGKQAGRQAPGVKQQEEKLDILKGAVVLSDLATFEASQRSKVGLCKFM